jgi:hypothetical protein
VVGHANPVVRDLKMKSQTLEVPTRSMEAKEMGPSLLQLTIRLAYRLCISFTIAHYFTRRDKRLAVLFFRLLLPLYGSLEEERDQY